MKDSAPNDNNHSLRKYVNIQNKFLPVLCLIITELRMEFSEQIRIAWKVLKCGAGEGWRRSVGPIMLEMKKCYLE